MQGSMLSRKRTGASAGTLNEEAILLTYRAADRHLHPTFWIVVTELVCFEVCEVKITALEMEHAVCRESIGRFAYNIDIQLVKRN